MAKDWMAPFGFITTLLVGGFYVVYLQSALPTPLGASAPAEVFSEERAMAHVLKIVGFGSARQVGSHANEKLTPAYLLEHLKELQRAAHSEVLIDVDVQHPSGTFDLLFLDGMTSGYANITNILVRLAPTAAADPDVLPSVLLNAHYDAVIGSRGASDDLAAVGTMIETVRALAAQPLPPDAAIVLLLNGAEENILQGSHGFTQQHNWTRSIKVFVNLEACGAGGREIVFQTGPGHPWITRLYAESVPRPHISVVAQEIFQAELIPSDTDFRIFRDYGQVPGVDMAWFENGRA